MIIIHYRFMHATQSYELAADIRLLLYKKNNFYRNAFLLHHEINSTDQLSSDHLTRLYLLSKTMLMIFSLGDMNMWTIIYPLLE